MQTWITRLFLAGWLITGCFAQSQGNKPALIRDTDKAEGKEDAEIAKPKEYSPLLADKSVKVGDFYFKRKNYDGAIQRYLEALEYQPNLIVAYEQLGRAYEKRGKHGDIDKARAVYKEFIEKHPESPKITEFRTRLSRLDKQIR